MPIVSDLAYPPAISGQVSNLVGLTNGLSYIVNSDATLSGPVTNNGNTGPLGVPLVPSSQGGFANLFIPPPGASAVILTCNPTAAALTGVAGLSLTFYQAFWPVINVAGPAAGYAGSVNAVPAGSFCIEYPLKNPIAALNSQLTVVNVPGPWYILLNATTYPSAGGTGIELQVRYT